MTKTHRNIYLPPLAGGVSACVHSTVRFVALAFYCTCLFPVPRILAEGTNRFSLYSADHASVFFAEFVSALPSRTGEDLIVSLRTLSDFSQTLPQDADASNIRKFQFMMKAQNALLVRELRSRGASIRKELERHLHDDRVLYTGEGTYVVDVGSLCQILLRGVEPTASNENTVTNSQSWLWQLPTGDALLEDALEEALGGIEVSP